MTGDQTSEHGPAWSKSEFIEALNSRADRRRAQTGGRFVAQSQLSHCPVIGSASLHLEQKFNGASSLA